MMQRPSLRAHALVFAALTMCLTALPAHAQSTPTTPAFSLATSHIYSTKESPAFSLTHRGVDHLDFRVYRVNDAFAFFEKLRDAHELGSEEPVVPQERTLLERIAAWKSERRSDVRGFIRRQFSPEYRHVRNQQQDQQQVVLRQTLNVNSFAQVPLLNASQLVTSWREILPPVREAEYRRIPLDVSSKPGIYVVEAVNAPLRAYTVVIVSDVGLVTKAAPGQLLVYAANRFSGEPLPGCRVEVLADQKAAGAGTTGTDGTFQADAVQVSELGSLVTIADCNGQAAATDPSAFSIREPSKTLVGYTYTDRPIYRPGHTVRYKSVLRWREHGALTPLTRDDVEVSIVDGDEKVLARERKTVDEFGAVNGSFVVPPTAKLGYYVIHVASGDDTATGSFEVQEYRKPEFDVAVTPASKLERQGGKATLTIAARYYFGQPVAGAAVTYTLHRQPYYSPLRFDANDDNEGDNDFFGDGGEATFEGTATLNDRGEARVTVPLDVEERGHDYTAHIEARVTDASGREVAGGASLAATYGRFMLVASADRYVHKPGEAMTARVRAVDYEGTALANTKVHVALEQVDYRDGYDNPRITTIAQGDLTTDAGGRAQWPTTAPSAAGSYRIRFSAPSEGREVNDTASIWVPGATADIEDDSDRFLELIADKRTYQPGDTARLMVQGEAFEASVLVTKESQHISYHQVVKTSSGNAIDVPITADDIGDTYVSIAFLKDDRLFRAERRLTVPAVSRQLNITAEADRPIVRPGEPGTFTLHVTDASGAPVRAQLSLGLVDEAVYGVRPDGTPDPLRFFYRREFNEVSTSFSRFYPFVGYSGTEQLLLAARRRKPMTLADFKADRPDRPRVRKDFPDTVYWAANVTTDTAGTARVKIDYPDSLTTWRLTVRGVTESTNVGATTTHTTTTKDLILRVITPRFLTEGDHVTVPAIVHNYLSEQAAVSVTVTGDGLTSPDGQNAARGARTITVPQNGQQRTDWDFAASAVRPVTLTGKATSTAAGDAMAITLPVNPAGLQRNAGTSGSLVGVNERSLQFSIPGSANASARTVRVSLAPSLAGVMLGALDYLTSFPWGCTEQTLSSFVPNLVVLHALGDMNITPTERLRSLDRQVADGLTRLYDYQHDDGGWGWWKTDQNHPFMTAYAVDGLLKAKEAGSKVDEDRIANGAHALVELWTKCPRAVPDLKAYEAYVLARAGAPGFNLEGAITELWNARSRMSTTGQAFLLMTLDGRKAARQAENATAQTPAASEDDSRANTLAAELLASAKTQGDLSSWPVSADALLEDMADTTVEATALALQALATRGTQDQTLERAARWLMANRNNGYWISTKQTAIALEGLLAFMKARGEKPAPVVADVLVNGTRVATTRFDAASLLAPNPTLIEAPATDGTNTVRITKQGEGAVYFDAGVRYYDPPASAERTGTRRLALLREYFSLTPVQVNGRIVYRESAFSGTAKPGDLILVRLTIAGSNDWRYLMLEDPLPAGAESIEKEESYEFEKRRSWDYGSQRELRDDRTVYFLDNLSGGRREFNYMLKVTTPGQFKAMPAHVSPMYVPDISASSDVMPLTVSAEGVR
ncbi:MAG: MG2 domain-containing protein [Vicinamibacterales bacterium]